MNGKIIIFEELRPIHKWIVWWYLFFKKEVYVLRIGQSVMKSPWMKWAFARGKLKKIDYPFDKRNGFSGTYYDMAFDNLDCFYWHIQTNKIIIKIKELYGSEDVGLAFKKELHNNLARFYFLNSCLRFLSTACDSRRGYFVPSKGIDLYRTDGSEIYDYFRFRRWANSAGAQCFDTGNISFAFWAIIFSYARAWKRGVFTRIEISVFLLWAWIRGILSGLKRKRGRAKYHWAVMISSSSRQFGNSIQKVDFLIDGDKITKGGTVFISNTRLNKKYKEYLQNNGLRYADDLSSCFSGRKIVKNVTPYVFSLMFVLQRDGRIAYTALKLIYFYLRWKGFVDNFEIQKLITHGDFGVQSIARNIILNDQGVKTYYYMDSANFGCFVAKGGGSEKLRHNYFGFLNYDYFVSWSDCVSRYFKDSHSKFKNYVDVGCLWSEHLRLIQEGKIKSDFKNKLYSQGYKEGMKIVSVFDSTFHDSSITTYDDGIEFLEGILKLLDDLPGVFVVIKEKKSRDYHTTMSSRASVILAEYAELENHKRCYSVKTWENSSEIIACSDLTISFPFTSTTFEAISAGERAVWYDASDKFKGSFYDSIPGLVCHSYGELLKRVKKLLFETSREEYAEHINKYIRGKVESYVDGKAITRFRGLLSNKNAGVKKSSFGFVEVKN